MMATILIVSFNSVKPSNNCTLVANMPCKWRKTVNSSIRKQYLFALLVVCATFCARQCLACKHERGSVIQAKCHTTQPGIIPIIIHIYTLVSPYRKIHTHMEEKKKKADKLECNHLRCALLKFALSFSLSALLPHQFHTCVETFARKICITYNIILYCYSKYFHTGN